MFGDMGKWQVRFDRPTYKPGINIWIFRWMHGYSEVLQPDGLVVRVAESDTISHLQPTMFLHGGEAEDIQRAFMAALTANGVKHPSDVKVQGLYEAQSRHLEDLRKLLKLDRGEKK